MSHALNTRHPTLEAIDIVFFKELMNYLTTFLHFYGKAIPTQEKSPKLPKVDCIILNL